MEDKKYLLFFEDVEGRIWEQVYSPGANEIAIRNERRIRSISGTLPPGVRSFAVGFCEALEKLTVETPDAVQFFSVIKCPRLQKLPERINATRQVSIRECSVLVKVSELPEHLESLFLMDLPVLRTLPLMPKRLGHFTLGNCPCLKKLPKLSQELGGLWLNRCNFKSLPQMPATIVSLQIDNCALLKTLPKMPDTLGSIRVQYCSAIERLPDLPGSLTYFQVEKCLLLKRLPNVRSSACFIHVRYCPGLTGLAEWLIKVNPDDFKKSLGDITLWSEALLAFGVSRCVRKGKVDVVRKLIKALWTGSPDRTRLCEEYNLERKRYVEWQNSVDAAQQAVKDSSDEIAKLAKTHEFARWRVAEKCGWSNSLNGQCKQGEPKSAYPDDLEESDDEAMVAIRKFIDIHRQMKTAKAKLKSRNKQLAVLYEQKKRGMINELEEITGGS